MRSIRAMAPGLLALVAAIAIARAQSRAPGSIAGRSVVPAIGAATALLVGGTLVVVEPDRLAVSGVDLVTGARTWRTVLPAAADLQELAAIAPGRVLVHVLESVVLLDVAGGAVTARQEVRGSAGSFLWQSGGACALRTRCELQVIDCDDAHPVGAPMRGRMVSRMRWDRSGWDSGCWGFSAAIVGRGGSIVVVSDGEGTLSGRDVRTGREVWRRRESVRELGGGASPDGSLCWVIDEDPAGALNAFECRTGRARFHASHVDEASWVGGPPAGLLVRAGGRTTLREPVHGRTLRSPPTPPAAAPPLFEVERGPANAPATVYLLRPSRRVVMRLPGDAWSLGEHTDAGGVTRMALFVYDPDGPGEVRVLSAPPP